MNKESKVALTLGALLYAGKYVKDNYDNGFIKNIIKYRKSQDIKNDKQAKIRAYTFLISSIISKSIPKKINYLEIPIPIDDPLTKYMVNNKLDNLAITDHILINQHNSLSSYYQVEWYPNSNKEDHIRANKESLKDTSNKDMYAGMDDLSTGQKAIIKKVLEGKAIKNK